MLMTVRFTAAAAMVTVGLFADTVYDTSSVFAPSQPCVSYALPCQPFDLAMPQFDQSLGTLDSITWSFADLQSYNVDMDYFAGPLPFAYSYTTMVGDTSSILGMSASNTQSVSGILYGYNVAGSGATPEFNLLQASGAISNGSAFLGTGMVNIAVTPDLSGWANDGIGFALDDVEDYASLDVTYNYTTVVPEPRLPALMSIAAVLLVLARRRKMAWQH